MVNPLLKRVLAVGFAACLLAGLSMVVMVLVAVFDNPFNNAEFSADEWAAALDCSEIPARDCERHRRSCTRGGMYESLTRGFLLVGETDRDQVLSLLGNPSHSESHRPRGIGEIVHCDNWFLGGCSGLMSPGDALYVCYGPEERIDRFGRYQY